MAGQLRAYRQGVGQRLRADLLLLPGDPQAFSLQHVDDLFGRAQLLAQRRFPQRRSDHVGGQGQVGGVELCTLIVGPGQLRLDAAAHATEQVECVAHIDRGVVERERTESAAHIRLLRRLFLAGGAGSKIQRREQPAPRRACILLGLAQRSLGRGN